MSQAARSPSPFERLLPPFLVSLTLGLAPFTPEPHLLGKLRWVAGGGTGMELLDWGDLAMHGAPWVWLIAVLVRVGFMTVGPSPTPTESSES